MPPRPPAEHATAPQIVFERLRHRILWGHYDSGQRLAEEDLAAEFGVSRTPVREAIRQLELEGLLQYSPRRGVVVRGLSPDDLAQINQVRAVLEGLAARLAATAITQRELDTLRSLQAQMVRANDERDFERAARIHTRYNVALYTASRNPALVRILRQFNDYIEHATARSLALPGRATGVREEHEAVLDAITRGDADAAEAAGRRHVEVARRASHEALTARDARNTGH